MPLVVKVGFCVVISILLVINIIMLVRNNKKVSKYTKMYEKTLAKFNSKQNIDDEFQTIYDRIGSVEDGIKDTQNEINILKQDLKTAIKKVGLVKYNAYNDSESKLSFALALLDENENGVLINHIYSKHGSNTYTKLVTSGKVDDRICDEEKEALMAAINDKEFKQRQTVDIATKKRK